MNRTGLLVAVSVMAIAGTASANSSGIIAEGVSDYSLVSGGTNPHAQDIDGAQEACGFMYTMTNGTAPTDFNACLTAAKNTGSTGYTKIHEYYNNSVYDSDIVDPDTSGVITDHDTTNFDQSGAAFSFLLAHGVCDDIATNTCASGCGLDQACTDRSPRTGLSDMCVNGIPRWLVFSSTGDTHGHFIRYGKQFLGSEVSSMRFGESPQSGGWAGASTNGGANGVFIVNSCGVRGPSMWDNMKGMFAGAHLINMVAPSGAARDASGNVFLSDTRTLTARGARLAQLLLANPFQSVASAWQNPTLMAFAAVGPAGVAIPSSFVAHGAHLSMSFDSTASLAQWHSGTEGAIGMQFDSNDATGNGFGAASWACNYDCNKYGL